MFPMMHNNAYFIVFCIIAHFDKKIDGKILSGNLVTPSNWAFLARFCFLSQKGKFTYDLIIYGAKADVSLLLYYDTKNQWPSVYPSNKTCQEKLLNLERDKGQIINLSPYSSFIEGSGCEFTTENRNETHCHNYREFRSARPHWWFIALSDCSSTDGLNISYYLSLTNGPPGSFWREHFSADEFYLLPEIITASCIYLLLIFFSIFTAVNLKKRKLLHVTYKLFMLSLTCQLCGLLCELYGYVYRALDGIERKSPLLIGNLFEAASETSFTTLLLLLSMGYTVTKSILSRGEFFRLTYFICCMICLQLLLFLYQSAAFDPGLVLYIYESPPGYGLLALKIWAWFIFIICCYYTSKKFVVKFRFYGSLVSLGSGWFLCQPLTVLLMTFFVDKWVRESVVKGGNLWVTFVGHITFLYVTRPGSTNVHFPFHIRIGQVVPVAGEGQSHSYEPNIASAPNERF